MTYKEKDLLYLLYHNISVFNLLENTDTVAERYGITYKEDVPDDTLKEKY